MRQPQRIAWIGAGRMGVPIAGFIMKAGYPLAVYSRSAASRAKLAALGAREAVDVAQCVRDADIVFVSVADDAALRAVALDEARGALAHAARGSVLVETSTVSHQISREIDAAARARGIGYLRAPISGNAASAAKGEVTVFTSGAEEDWLRVRPVLQTFSTAQVYLGAGDEARSMKLVANLLVINMAQALAEALALGSKAGLQWQAMLDTLAQSTVASPFLKAKLNLLKTRDYTPTMTARLIMKDVDLMLSAAREGGVPLPLTATTQQLLQTLVSTGRGEDDYMRLVELAEQQAGLAAR